MPTGLVLCIAGALVQFWLHSRIEIGGDAMPDDETFIRHIMQLIQTP